MDLLFPTPPPSPHTLKCAHTGLTRLQGLHKHSAKLDNIVQPLHIQPWQASRLDINADMMLQIQLTLITETLIKRIFNEICFYLDMRKSKCMF